MTTQELIEALKDEQRKACAYWTRDGDGRTCDCKYSLLLPNHEFRNEHSGCPELRQAIRVLEAKVREENQDEVTHP